MLEKRLAWGCADKWEASMGGGQGGQALGLGKLPKSQIFVQAVVWLLF